MEVVWYCGTQARKNKEFHLKQAAGDKRGKLGGLYSYWMDGLGDRKGGIKREER